MNRGRDCPKQQTKTGRTSRENSPRSRSIRDGFTPSSSRSPPSLPHLGHRQTDNHIFANVLPLLNSSPLHSFFHSVCPSAFPKQNKNRHNQSNTDIILTKSTLRCFAFLATHGGQFLDLLEAWPPEIFVCASCTSDGWAGWGW